MRIHTTEIKFHDATLLESLDGVPQNQIVCIQCAALRVGTTQLVGGTAAVNPLERWPRLIAR